MSEHGWPDFHDDGPHHDDGHHDDGLPADELPQPDDVLHDLHHDDDPAVYETPEHHDGDAGMPAETHDVSVQHEPAGWDQPDEVHEQPPPGELGSVGADPDALSEPAALAVFPPMLDVGELPEPVDGFPWIDTGSLGLVDFGGIEPAGLHDAAAGAVSPQELAAYAGTELAPGVDPWAALADSDDPATSALAKWWSENT